MNNQLDPITQLLNQIKRRFNWKNQTLFLVFILIVAGLWVFITGLYTVGADEVAVIQRFGKYVRMHEQGIWFKWPDGIEKRTNVKVTKEHTEEFGQRTKQAGVKTQFEPESRYIDESLMLTGDLNCAVVPWIVLYRISDPVSYLFKVREPEATLRDMSEAIMRQVVGDRSIDEILSEREAIASMVEVELQKALDEAGTGMTVTTIELQNTTVPEPVQPSFNEVNQAEQEKKKMINEARGEYNKVVPAAHGEAEKIIRQAEGYALDRLNKARGDSSRFVSLHNEYARAKDVTRRRMYLETMNDILPKLGNKYVVDYDQKGVLPLLNLGEKGGK